MRIAEKFFTGAIVLLIVTLLSAEARAEKKIGILLWSEAGRYVAVQKSIVEQMKKEGFGEPNVKFTVESAGGNKAKAAELARKFADARMDMVFALGTSAAVYVAKEIKDAPVIFFVYDPVESKLAENWKSSGNNTTGCTNWFPMSKLVSSLKQLAPVKKLAVLYTPGEKNSEAQLKVFQSIQNELQIKIVPVPLTTKEEVAQIIPEVSGAVDAMYLSGSNVVAEMAASIANIATKRKVITMTHLEDLVEKGVLFAVYADPFKVGRLCGEKAVKVLKGAKPASVPIGTLKKLDVIINMKTVKAGQFNLPPDFMKTVTKIIE